MSNHSLVIEKFTKKFGREPTADELFEYAREGRLKAEGAAGDRVTILLNLDLEVEVDADVIAGTRDKFDSSFGNWLPGDPPIVKNIKVYLTQPTGIIDITSALPGSAIDHIAGELLKEAGREGIVS